MITEKKIRILYVLIFLASCLFASNKIDSLEKVLKQNLSDTERVKTLSKLCWEYNDYNPKKALEYGNKALELAKQIGFKKGEAMAYNNMGSAYSGQGDYEMMMEYYKKGLELRKELGDSTSIGVSMNNVGLAYNSRSEYSKSIKYFMDAMSIFEKTRDKKIWRWFL